MKNKAPLALMEQTVMILVFALAAALCLRVFVWSDRTSRRLADRDQAAILAQNAAELLKHAGENGAGSDEALEAAAGELGGVCRDGVMTVEYNKQWETEPGAEAYRLEAREASSDVPGLCLVDVEFLSDDDVLFKLQAAWQGEVEPLE